MTRSVLIESLSAAQTELTSAHQGVQSIDPPIKTTNVSQAEFKQSEKDTSSSHQVSVIRVSSPSESSQEDPKALQKKLPYGGRPLRFKCEKCDRRFHAPSHLKRHLLCHSSERPFQCDICKKGFLQAWHLGRHMTTHTGNKPFNCSDCPKSFGSRFEMKTHYNYIHQGIKEHECKVCRKMFTLRSNLKVHMRKHTGEKPYQCHICLKKFGQRGHLQYHFKKHAAEDNSKWLLQNEEARKAEQTCNASTASNAPASSNVAGEERHFKVPSKVVKANSAEEGISKPPELLRERRVLSDSSKITSPDNINAEIMEKMALKLDLSDQPRCYSKYQLPTIMSRFNYTSEHLTPLSGRIYDHTNPSELKPFVCVTCNCGFGEINSLRAHVRHSHPRKGIMLGDYLCAYCNRTFSEINQLRQHFHDGHQQTPTEFINVGQKRRYEDVVPPLKRTTSAIMFPPMKSPDAMSTSSDKTFDRKPSFDRDICAPFSDCYTEGCSCRKNSLSSLAPVDTEYLYSPSIRAKYIYHLEQYHRLIESHVSLVEAIDYRKKINDATWFN